MACKEEEHRAVGRVLMLHICLLLELGRRRGGARGGAGRESGGGAD